MKGISQWLGADYGALVDAQTGYFGVDRDIIPERFRPWTPEESAAYYLQEGMRVLALPDLSYAPDILRKAIRALRYDEEYDGVGGFEAYYQAAWALRRLIENR